MTDSPTPTREELVERLRSVVEFHKRRRYAPNAHGKEARELSDHIEAAFVYLTRPDAPPEGEGAPGTDPACGPLFPTTKPGSFREHGDTVVFEPCPNALLPDGPVCPRCGGARAPSGVDGGSWVHFPTPTEGKQVATLHVQPINDAMEHEDSEACACSPRVEIVEGGRIVIHNAADGRK